MGPKRISTIVVSYNVSALLHRCLSSLPSGTEVIVVDNASSDDSVQMVRRCHPTVAIVVLAKNLGFSAAINAGAERATGDALLLLNPDTQLPSSALEKMAQALGRSEDCAAVGFRQADATGQFQLACGPQPGFWGELGRRFVQRRLDAGSRSVAALVDRALRRRRRVAWVAGSSLLVWRRSFDAVGGFDTRYFLFFEDIDFCLRLRRTLKAHVYYDPVVTVLHHRGQSARTSSAMAERAYRQSQVLFWRTHHGAIWGQLMARYVAHRAGAA